MKDITLRLIGNDYLLKGISGPEELGEFVSSCAIDEGRAKEPYIVELEHDPAWKDRSASYEQAVFWKEGALAASLAFCDAEIDFRRRHITARGGAHIGLFGLMRFVSAVRLMRSGGFLLHASSVLTPSGVCIFSARSGGGKTTIARLARGKATILTDETTAVTRSGVSYRAHSTPFVGDLGWLDKDAAGPVRAVFFIVKDMGFRHRRLGSKEAISGLFSNAMLTVDDRRLTESLFGTFDSFASAIPCYELGFAPTDDLWRYIDGITE